MPEAPYEQLLRWDAELVQLSRGIGAAVLAIGYALERLKCNGWHRELGFSALEYYALERCSRSRSWTTETTALARRLERLPRLRRALVQGRVNLSMATLVSRKANAESDEFMTAKARRSTVREMREYLRGLAARDERVVEAAGDMAGAGPEEAARVAPARVAEQVAAPANDEASGSDPAQEAPVAKASYDHSLDEDARCMLAVRISASDHLVLQRSMALLRGLNGHGDDDDLVAALLGEADLTLIHAVSQTDGVSSYDVEHQAEELHSRGRQQAALRADSERRCEQSLRARAEGGRDAIWPVPPEPGSMLLEQFQQAVAQIEAARTPRKLDQWIQARCRELARRDLEIGRVSVCLSRADGWRRLQFASQAHYASERLGLSASSLESKQFLARRARWIPALGGALRGGKLGVEGAIQVARVATPETAGEWVARAVRRTVKHLREEVDVAVRLRRCAGRTGCRPPTEEHMRKLAKLEAELLSGKVELQSDWPLASEELGEREGGGRAWECSCSTVPSTQMSGGTTVVRCGSDDSTQLSGGQAVDGGPACEGKPFGNRETKFRAVVHEGGRARRLSSLPWLLGLVDVDGKPTAAHAKGGHGGGEQLEELLAAIANELCVGKMRVGARRDDVTVTFRLRRETYWYWRRLEEQARMWLPRTVSFVRFISLCVWNAHRYEVPTEVAYARVHARDGYRCTSPVCCKRTVQPHHLKKRSQGGGDEEENVAALCCDCHLDGVHAGRLKVEPPASRMLWSIGRDGGLVVLGREVIRAA